ncbi:hypothetical protein ANOM_006383 [Aspergillus nomiae NRRL 13137]|uniref:ATP-grasp domain-containing protein n=1 Tax=Aspergillus nomiae NRRL (strain ATCC 15546 / NRRL 13137 / CBS 260.88 / M93) TaxID=1509407 RepID=A0A0L1J541_ASPN3|nr:uncharacterized protein ANOM_006383 [Aspergillus nomiae NRRL 13137]KNG86857.1 hypothetical protein ANOM_006383 [Aspergillus nomiae NRRL 13137]
MTSRKVQVRSKSHKDLLLEYSWSLLDTPSTGNPWQSVDIVLRHVFSVNANSACNSLEDAYILDSGPNSAPQEYGPEAFGSHKAFQFFLQCLRAATTSRPRIAKLIVPLQKGHIVRSDIIPLRLRDSQYIETAVSFAEPFQSYTGSAITPPDASNLPALFSAATAGLLLQHNVESDSYPGFEALSLAVESDLENRLSFPWTLSEPIHRKTLVLVDANSSHPEDGVGLYHAARVLGIDIVVLDNKGHWLEGPKDVADRIVESVKAYGKPVDGIVTFADSFWPYIAQAAPQVGLQTASQAALRIATNKYLTSVFAGHQAYLKPCDGWSSEGVSRVDNLDALTMAVNSIDVSRHGTAFVIEKYCDGPEVDVNFVLLDGEVLFFEVCDDLPKSADINGPSIGSLHNFHELNSVYPSALPPQEIDLLRRSFLDTLLKLGLRDGVMHLEGRVEHSSVEYTKQNNNNIIDLSPRAPTQQPPTPWLIEINPRPLGMTGSHIIESTYGIDYWGLALLIAVGDKPRVRALSQPFKHGPQYTCVMVFIPADYPINCQGIFDSDDICADLIARRPDLAKQISRCACLVKRGQKIAHPSSGRHTFLAYFNVFSRVGRKEALDLARKVREEVRYSFI